jgi:hypothetical protein
MSLKLLLLTHAAATLIMVGVIWVIQVVHYPLFSRVGADAFPAYHAAHNVLITWVVLPTMFVELATAALLVVARPVEIALPLALLGLGLVGVIWLSTFFLQVPEHARLAAGFDAAAHRLLVNGNWLRTAAWSVRGLLALWFLALRMT